ncbi:GspE/PulE family protein [Rhodomicrobium lacus]|uniref:GspE/PulE family protein n=1 Tax=Rhodomicrobium lacus TaxID=2498452 RepID=UPI000F8E0CB9|nr:GspE/PulE family protein [Rhodomicrobium lacus]
MNIYITELEAKNQSISENVKTEQDFIELLIQDGWLNSGDVSRLRRARLDTRKSILRLIPSLGLLDEKKLALRLANWLQLPLFSLDSVPPKALLSEKLNVEFLRAQGLLPAAIEDGSLIVATSDPLAQFHRRAIEIATGLPVSFVVGTSSDIEKALARLYEEERSVSEIDQEGDESHDEDLQRLKDMAAEAPVIRYVNQVLQQAVDKSASDIHFEPFQGILRVRLRIDGHLQEIQSPPAGLASAISSRVKLLAKLNIAERRLPQDGRIRTVIQGRSMDIRISTTPTLYGESVVLRLLDKTAVSFNFADLGFHPSDLKRFFDIISKPNGIVLVTGPTGSGKTTTLYTCLLHLNNVETKILTVEDPVEYELPGINQIQVKPQIGLTFSSALRSLVRQDPDIILIGEIRDLETAEIASQSALTGHRVLSTLHTNDASSAVTRLLDMGVPDYLIAATVRGVVAQRLVRCLCSACKKRTSILASGSIADKLSAMGADAVFEPQGCELCDGTGYRGRMGIYEILPVSTRIREMIADRSQATALEAAAIKEGMTSLYDDGLRKVAEGKTSFAEVLRATKEV